MVRSGLPPRSTTWATWSATDRLRMGTRPRGIVFLSIVSSPSQTSEHSAAKTAVPTAINDAGQIAGYFGTEPHADYADHRAFLLTNGNLITLGTLGGRLTTALDLNNLGHVVGRAHTSRGDARAFLYTGGDLTDLGTLAGGRQSAAHAINDSGQVVGASESAAGPQRAFLYSGGVLRDLNTLISTSSGWHLSEARDINNSGVIVGIGLRNGEQRGFLLKPR